MTNVLESATITNNCVCIAEDGENVTCYGECYEDSFFQLNELIEQWVELNKHKATDTVAIHGERMGWQGLYGLALVEVSDDLTEDIRAALQLDRADWTLVFKLSEEGALSAVRYSHDEPTGAGFSFGYVPVEVNFSE